MEAAECQKIRTALEPQRKPAGRKADQAKLHPRKEEPLAQKKVTTDKWLAKNREDMIVCPNQPTDDFQKLLFETVPYEQKGKLEGTVERGLFSIHLHEGTFRLPGLSHREEIVGSPSGCAPPGGGQAIIISVPPVVHPLSTTRESP
jgi:hypothetical protein